jgi:hypothetical protein
MSTPCITAATITSSTALRLRHLAGRIHRLGPYPLYHLLCELSGSSAVLDRLESYAALDGDFIRALGGDRLPPTICRVK